MQVLLTKVAVAVLRVAHDHGKCTSCMDCLKVCPENEILSLVGKASGSVLDGACTNCGRCIEVCPTRARVFGDLNDRSSVISQFVDNNQVQVLKPESGNGPMCFYIGIDEDVS